MVCNRYSCVSCWSDNVLSGGHLKPDPLSRAAGVLDKYGKDVAEHVASFEARQVDAIKDLVQREQVDCDFEETSTLR